MLFPARMRGTHESGSRPKGLSLSLSRKNVSICKNIKIGEGRELQKSDGDIKIKKASTRKLGGKREAVNFRGTVDSAQHSMTLKISSISLCLDG